MAATQNPEMITVSTDELRAVVAEAVAQAVGRPAKSLLTYSEAAAVLGVHRNRVADLAKEGQLDIRYLSGKKRPLVTRASIDAFTGN